MRPTRLAAIAVMLALGACQEQPAKQEAPAAAPEAKPGMVLSAVRLVLPAVKGNPGAAYFKLENNGSTAASLAAVAIEGAGKAEVHQATSDTMMPVDSVDVDPRTPVDFKPGELHVMVFDLDPKLAPGGKTEITLTFADGDKLSAELTIESAGQAAMGTEHDH
jgi:periplasmic copper chaperone A